MARRERKRTESEDADPSDTAPVAHRPAVARIQAYHENPQAWLGVQEYSALLRIVEARHPGLFQWFRAERNDALKRLVARLQASSRQAEEDEALSEWARQLGILTPPARLVPKRRDTFGRWIWAAYYFHYIRECLRSCWKKGQLAVGINVLLGNNLPALFTLLEIPRDLQPSENKLRKWAQTKSLEGFVLEVVAHMTGWGPSYVKRGIARLRASYYDEFVRSSGDAVYGAIPFLARARLKRRIK